MREIIEIIKGNKWLILPIIALPLFFIGWSVFMLSDRSQEQGQEGSGSYYEYNEGQYSQNDSSLEATVTITPDDLPDRLADVREGYTSEQYELIDFLRANLWLDEHTGTLLRFEELSFTLRTGEIETEPTPYVFSVLSSLTPHGQGIGSEMYVAVIETEGATNVMVINFALSQDPTIPDQWSLFSPLFSDTATFVRTSPDVEVEVENFPEEVAGYFISREVVVEKIEELVSLFHPTATEARWNGTVELDFIAQMRRTTFTLNDHRNTTVEVIFCAEEERVEVK